MNQPESSKKTPKRRVQTICDTYIDLMKPEEILVDFEDTAEWRKIRNRLAQRAYSKYLEVSEHKGLGRLNSYPQGVI
jgi:hypothetical protein